MKRRFASFYIFVTACLHNRHMLNSLHINSTRLAPSGQPKKSASTVVPQAKPETVPADVATIGSAKLAASSSFDHFFRSMGKSSFERNLEKVNRAEAAAKKLKTPADFQAQTKLFKARLAAGEDLDSLQVEAYAVARQAAVHATGMRPYDCQILGALAMNAGNISEMMTGEGKTLTAVMPLYLNALAGKGAQLVTVNDTLAQRDMKEMAPIFETLGLTVGAVLEDMTPEEKRENYNKDVTYTTDRSIGFDYLRDRTARHISDRVQREPFFALIDEVDQVLLDEARTPLIISGKGEAASEEYHTFNDIVKQLKPGTDYFVNREQGTVWPTETGLDFIENELSKSDINFKNADAVAAYHRNRGAIRAEGKAFRALNQHRQSKPKLLQRILDKTWSEEHKQLESKYHAAKERQDQLDTDYNLYSPEHSHQLRYLQASLKAHALMDEGTDYLIQDQQVRIVDENKGRTSPGRRFNEGLHQGLEAKAGVPLRPESRPIASITYPNLFKRYPRLAGMSGTAKTSEGEFQELYKLDVVKVPTNLQFKLNPAQPSKARRHNRIDETDAVFATKKARFEAVVSEALEAYQEGVPVLIGTLSVEANQYLYAKLTEAGVAPGALQLLNAENVRGDKALENAIIGQAGRSGMITVATNMAGRGVNIKPDMVNYKKLSMAIEEKVLAQEPVAVVVNKQKEADKLALWLDGNFPYSIGETASKAGEVLIQIQKEDSTDSNPAALKSSDFPTGGLYVIGTERAKSRRIDDQLIGRSARQGKPGRSKFFLSLEDELFREFGGQSLQPTLALLSGHDGKIENSLVEGLVEKVQARVGEKHFSAREHTTDYDKVLNQQRETFYAIRDSILDPNTDLRHKLTEDTVGYVDSRIEEKLGSGKHSAQEISDLAREISKELKMDLNWKHLRSGRSKDVAKALSKQVRENLTQAFASFDASDMKLDELYRESLLIKADANWSDHLYAMTNLKQAVQWTSMAGQKPEDAYKTRGFEAFESNLQQMWTEAVSENVPQIMVGSSILKDERKSQAA